jgi:tRNA-(ms[2]io[6]A)-hydroxylase
VNARAAPDLGPLKDFLGTPTPRAWCEAAPANLEVLLLDHASCEKKAASTALSLLFRHSDVPGLALAMSRLAREELRHFEQVDAHLRARAVAWRPLSASRYAAGLRAAVRGAPAERLVDVLVCGAFVEARSAERFDAVAPYLDAELARFYRRLLASEARHFETYLDLARQVADADAVAARVEVFRMRETELVTSPDPEFRFHSGVPA